jgi:group I intron endonuclease
MFIYLITNAANGKFYVGKWAGPRLLSRWHSHLAEVRRGSKSALHNAIRKYGPGAFGIRALTEVNISVDELSLLERLWIMVLGAQNRKLGYNISAGGDGASYRRSEETRRRMSAARYKLYQDPDMLLQQAGICRGMAGIPKNFTDASRTRLAESGRKRRGEKRSEESKARMRVARLAFFETEKGKETKERLRANKGNGNLGGGKCSMR